MKQLKFLSFLLSLLLVSLVACDKKQEVAEDSVPTVVTSTGLESTLSTISYSGEVTADGGSTVTARGVCYATHESPTLSDKYTTDGAGLGTFSGRLSGLAVGKVYYVRAYATNKVGTAYGVALQVETKRRSVQELLGAEQATIEGESKVVEVETREGTIRCTEIGGKLFYQGDILISDDHLRGVGLSSIEDRRWPGNVFVYDIDPDFPHQERIADAIKLYEGTNIKFKRRTNEKDYAYFHCIPGDGCYSYVGRIGGIQDIVIDDWGTPGTVVHEIAHALGLLHEQCKPNRDQFIRVLRENIEPGREHNFDITAYETEYDEEFDFSSIMLYHSWSFAKDPARPTITKLDSSTFNPQRERLSERDKAMINRLYPLPTIPVDSIVVVPNPLILEEGQEVTVRASIFPKNGGGRQVNFYIQDPYIAQVMPFGPLEANVAARRVGKTTMVVSTESGVKRICPVAVVAKTVRVRGITLSPRTRTIEEGGTFTLTPSIFPSNATNKSVLYRSSNESVARVSSSGQVTAIKAGKATITVETVDGGKTDTCAVTVVAAPPKDIRVESVTVSPTSKSLEEGGTFTLTPSIFPSNATNKSVRYRSSNESVARVSSSGQVTAIKAGKATITVETVDGGKTDTCAVTVVAAPPKDIRVESVTVSPTSKSLEEGDYFMLKPTVLPANATNKSVRYRSSNESVARVSSSGQVTAIKAGKAMITVETVDGGKTATCAVTVEAAPKEGDLPDVIGEELGKR